VIPPPGRRNGPNLITNPPSDASERSSAACRSPLARLRGRGAGGEGVLPPPAAYAILYHVTFHIEAANAQPAAGSSLLRTTIRPRHHHTCQEHDR
jgi:hypothetical protein